MNQQNRNAASWYVPTYRGLPIVSSEQLFDEPRKSLPHVANVTRHGPAEQPTHRIIHFCNWHLVDPQEYAADLHSQSDDPLTNDELNRYQTQLVDEVSVLQVQQVQLLTQLIDNHGVNQVHLEGFCIGQEASFKRIIGEWTETERRLAELKAGVADFGDDERAKPIAAKIQEIEDGLNLEKAHYGAAGQLWHDGFLEKVLPCEDERLLDAAKPIAADGTYREDAEAIEAREDFIVRTLLESGPVSYAIHGKAVIPDQGADPGNSAG